jgi:hypothetical protein
LPKHTIQDQNAWTLGYWFHRALGQSDTRFLQNYKCNPENLFAANFVLRIQNNSPNFGALSMQPDRNWGGFGQLWGRDAVFMWILSRSREARIMMDYFG